MQTVDIIILSWDRIEETEAAIISALNQKGIGINVIVVDQGSSSANVERLTQFCGAYPAVNLVCNHKNLGVPGGRNQAAYLGRSPYIVSLDNDAEFTDDHQVATAVAIMESHQELAAIGFRILCFGTSTDDLSSWSYGQPAAEWAHRAFYTTHFVGAGHMLRRDAFEKVNGYDDTLFFLEEEFELSRKLINCGYKIRYSPEVTIGHKVSTERRISWNGPRWRYHVRNRLYLNIKFRKSIPALCLSTFLMLYKGIRSGLLYDSLVGIGQGLARTPSALTAISKPGVKSNLQAEQYISGCLHNKGLSRWQRIKHRFVQAKVPSGNSDNKNSRYQKAPRG